jgi:simple sugar transport system permease protein
MRLEARESAPLVLTLLAPPAAIAAALLLCSLLIIWAGKPVGVAYTTLFTSAAGSLFALTETFTRATPLILTGLAAAVAFRAKLWNIGGEGQLYAGALAATVLGSGLIQLPSFAMIPLLVIAGALAGAALMIGPAVLKLRFGVDEVVTTLLLNFIVLLFVSLLLEGPLKDPMSMGWPQAAPIIQEGELPKLVERQRLHAGLLIALAASLIVWIVQTRTVWGFEMRAIGANIKAATFLGLPVNMALVRVALLSGGLAGIAGVSEVAGLKGYLTLDMSPGYGYAGIVVAMLAQLHPLGVVLAALFVAGIFVGADGMSRAVEVPTYIADVIVAASLLCMLVAMLTLRYRIRWG